MIPEESFIEEVARDRDISDERKPQIIRWIQQMRAGYVLLEQADWHNLSLEVNNLWLSKCFSCQEIAVWVSERMLFPAYDFVIAPNDDLPEEIRADFIEAAKIIDLSSRGSAALLRLCIQKLCKYQPCRCRPLVDSHVLTSLPPVLARSKGSRCLRVGLPPDARCGIHDDVVDTLGLGEHGHMA
jgi:hypothetical protein